MVGSRTTDYLEGAIGAGLLVTTGDALIQGTHLHSYPNYHSQYFVGCTSCIYLCWYAKLVFEKP